MKCCSRFKIKNQTEFPIFVMLTLEKRPLEVENIQPGTRVSDSYLSCSNFYLFPKGSFWRSVGSKAKKLGSTLERALADSEDVHVQRNRVVLDICPESFGFKEILPG